MGFLSPSPIELVVLLIIALLVLGPSRLPETARALGRGMREMRESLQGLGDDHDEEPRPRRDDPGGLPVAIPADIDLPYDDDLPDGVDYASDEDDDLVDDGASTPPAND